MKKKYAAELTLGERGQVVIPKATRDRLGLKPKMKIEMVESQGEMKLTPVRDVSYLKAAFMKWRGTIDLQSDGFKNAAEYQNWLRGRG